MKIDISQLDISMSVSSHLKKHLDTVLTEEIIWHLTMDIQYDFDMRLIEIVNKQFSYDKIEKETI